MTAGRGVVHSEMPEQEEGRMRGFQLWVNLPADAKMTVPKYQEFAPDNIPQVAPVSGVAVKVIAGVVDDANGKAGSGPIEQPATQRLYLDIAVEAGVAGRYALPGGP